MIDMKKFRIIVDGRVVDHKSFTIRGSKDASDLGFQHPYMRVITSEGSVIRGKLLSCETVAEEQFSKSSETVWWTQFTMVREEF
jgi:hypothetical protein